MARVNYPFGDNVAILRPINRPEHRAEVCFSRELQVAGFCFELNTAIIVYEGQDYGVLTVNGEFEVWELENRCPIKPVERGL